MFESTIPGYIAKIHQEHGIDSIFKIDIQGEVLLGNVLKYDKNALVATTYFGGDRKLAFKNITSISHVRISYVLTVVNGVTYHLKRQIKDIGEIARFLERQKL